MYVLHERPHSLHRWHPDVSLLWRGRWVALAVLAVALLTLAYTREAGVGPAAGGGGPVRYETVTVVSGDTLWSIASHRYPDADAREMVCACEAGSTWTRWSEVIRTGTLNNGFGGGPPATEPSS